MHDNTFTATHKDQKDNFHKHLNQQIIQYIKEVQEKNNNYVKITFSWLLGHPWQPTDYEQQFTANRHIPTDC